MPFARTTLGAEQPLIASELLGQGRDPLAPIKDAVTADGDVVVPIDVEAFGFWLKAAFGAPTTTGTTPKTHTFQSGNWTLPSMAIEVAMPEVPRFAMYEEAELKTAFSQILAIDGGDGLVYDVASLTAVAIREDQIYGGMRLRTDAYLGSTRIPITVDLGFGDALAGPAPVSFRYFESNTRHQGDRKWHRYTATSSSGMQFASRRLVA